MRDYSLHQNQLFSYPIIDGAKKTNTPVTQRAKSEQITKCFRTGGGMIFLQQNNKQISGV